MSLIARCPACQTSYRLVPDQLRISDGWVRCGLCGEVFDASQQLGDTETEQSATGARAPPADLAHTQPRVPDAPGFGDGQLAVTETSALSQQASSTVSTVESPVRHGALTALPASELSWTSATLLIRPSSESESEAGSEAVEPSEPSLSPSAVPVSFMLEPDVTSGVRRSNRPLWWWALGGILTLGLLLQGLYRERDFLATVFPGLKPALVSACEILACRVSPLQGIEHLAIDSATFHQVGPETFELRFAVKNNARHVLALPAIELTLTDLADQPVMRRVFTPAELGVASGTVAPADEWSTTAYLRVRKEPNGPRAQGYRLLIFYP